MPRLIDIRPVAAALPSPLVVDIGDILQFSASGGRVAAGAAVKLLGIFIHSTLGTDGRVLTPQGPPNVVIFQAHAAGQAAIDLVTGDAWHAPATARINIHVNA